VTSWTEKILYIIRDGH